MTIPENNRTMKASPVFNAIFIGFLIGIVIYSLMANTWGLFTLLPLYMAYRLMRKPEDSANP